MSVSRVMQAIYDRLAGDEPLRYMLAEDPDTHLPAVYDTWTHHETGPYVTLTTQVDDTLDRAIDQGSIQVDVWDRGPQTQGRVSVLDIRDRIVAILDQYYDRSGPSLIRFYKSGESPENEDSGRMRRWRLTFVVRWGRATDIRKSEVI